MAITSKMHSTKKYYEQLYEETLKFKWILPRQYIEHLKNRWVKIDTLVIKPLRRQVPPRMGGGLAHRVLPRASPVQDEDLRQV